MLGLTTVLVFAHGWHSALWVDGNFTHEHLFSISGRSSRPSLVPACLGAFYRRLNVKVSLSKSLLIWIRM
jgi:hypothetical protein